MKQFKLSRQRPGESMTRFHVIALADNSTCGIITVANEQADDLERHWLGAPPQAKAQDALTPGDKANPMVAAMVRAARKHPFNRAAVLRGC
jgi:hypothetical protein